MKNTLLEIRNKLGFSQSELGMKIGKSQSAIAHYEKGIRFLSLGDAYKILDLAKKKKIKIKLEDIYPREDSEGKS